MDDDIRNRFRGTRREFSAAVPARPVAPRPVPVPKPQSAPTPAPVRPTPPVAPPERPKATPLPKPPKRKRLKWRMSKKVALILLLILLLAAGAGAYVYKKRSHKPAVPQNQAAQTSTDGNQPKLTGTIRLIATGDNLAFDSVNSSAQQSDGTADYLPMMTQFKTFFDRADIGVCNISTPGGGNTDGLAISGYPNFNAPIGWSTSFARLGCNVMNLASDHINDKGQTAIDNTLKALDGQSNIKAVAGANRSAEDQQKIHYFTVKGLKFAYLAYTTNVLNKQVSAFGVNQYSDDLAGKQIAEARKNAHIVLVSMNWGTENSSDITADQDRIAQFLANQNADVVLGGGPHVLQPAKILDGKDGHQSLVWFSLGNFLNSQLEVQNLIGGMAVMDFDAGTQKISDPKLLPVYMHYEWTAAEKSANKVTARHGLQLYPLDLAADALAKSLANTTVEAQTTKVTGIITKFAPIKVIKSSEF